jgi:hypothetical protein
MALSARFISAFTIQATFLQERRGVATTIAINNEFMRQRIATTILVFEKQAPAIFYGLLFPFLYEVSKSFSFIRSLRHTVIHLLFGF